MKLFFQSLMIFFGTLLAAGLVALGEPGRADVALGQAGKPALSKSLAGPGERTPHQDTDTVLARWLPVH